MKGRIGLIGALALVALISVPAAAWATFIPGPPGKVVWTSGRANTDKTEPANGNDDNARLWVADYPFGTPVQVTTGTLGVQHRHPSWSPDHTKIVYAAGAPFSGTYALRIKDLTTGSDTQFVAAAEAQDRPSWSPDGTEIAYGSQGDLWVKGVAPGSEPVRVTDNAGTTEERPVWSPDGNTLYYNRGVPPFNAGTKRDLYKISPVSAASAETPILATEEDEWQPALSPDGNTLCFTRGPMSSAADVYLVGVNGGLVTPFSTSAAGNINCVWSPDGSEIIYTLGVFSDGGLARRDANGTFDALPSAWSVANHFDGNADWATNFPPECDDVSTAVGVNEFTTIQLSCTDPDFGPGVTPPKPTAIDAGELEIVSPPANGAIGGITDEGTVIYTPNKDFRGTDTFSYTADDEFTEAPPATVTINVGQQGGGADNTPPRISNIKVSNKRWRRGKKLASISAAPVGTTISFNLNEKARATLTFQRKVRRGGKAKFVGAGKLGFAAKAGKNRVRFQGLIKKSKKLATGTYRVVVRARDGAGNSSKKNGPTFTIVPQ
jgi:hypothetical protein